MPLPDHQIRKPHVGPGNESELKQSLVFDPPNSVRDDDDVGQGESGEDDNEEVKVDAVDEV